MRIIISLILFLNIGLPTSVIASDEKEIIANACNDLLFTFFSFNGKVASIVAKPDIPEPKEVDSSWRGNWFGYNIPVPVIADGWTAESLEVLSALHHPEKKFKITVQPALFEAQSNISAALSPKGSHLPSTNLTNHELLELGLSITPADIECGTGNTQQIINQLAALAFKGLIVSEGDNAYFLPDRSILVHRVYKKGERWEHFSRSDHSPLTKNITIQHWNPGEYSNIGFGITAAKRYDYSNGEPAWLVEFFESSEKRFPEDRSEYQAAIDALKEN